MNVAALAAYLKPLPLPILSRSRPNRPLLPGLHGRGIGMKTRKRADLMVAASLAASLIKLIGLPMMQEIAALVPAREKGNPGRPREDEFQRVCLLHLTEPGLKFTAAAKRVSMSVPNTSADGFASTVNKLRVKKEKNDPAFWRNFALQIADNELGRVRADLFPDIAASQSLADQVQSLRPTIPGITIEPALQSVREVQKLYAGQQETVARIRRGGDFANAFDDLIPDETPVDEVEEVHSLARRLVKAWLARRNI